LVYIQLAFLSLKKKVVVLQTRPERVNINDLLHAVVLMFLWNFISVIRSTVARLYLLFFMRCAVIRLRRPVRWSLLN
jgi:hypothetical protein